MEILITIAVFIVVMIFPVMLAADFLNARNTGFLSCLVAVILSALAGGFVTQFFYSPAISMLVSFAVSALIFSVVLGAKYIQSACIALLAIVIQYATVFVLGMLGLSLAATL